MRKMRILPLSGAAKRIYAQAIAKKRGGVVVDWELYVRELEKQRDDQAEHLLNWHLIEAGVLCDSHDGKPCYRVQYRGLGLGPLISGASLCFLRLSDAEAYRDTRFAGVQFTVDIRPINVVEDKEVNE